MSAFKFLIANAISRSLVRKGIIPEQTAILADNGRGNGEEFSPLREEFRDKFDSCGESSERLGERGL